jgi:sulfite reductase (ferredoxin)
MDNPSELSPVERLKAASGHLRGHLADEVEDSGPSFTADSTQILKFHGIYQQDDRDVRTERRKRGLGVDHICMVRVSIPGGVLTSTQYLALDDLADRVGNGTLRVTTRQGVQFHFVRKVDLRALMGELHTNLMTTLGACGDVVRNTMGCPAPFVDGVRAALEDQTQAIARHFRPRTAAYAEVWLDGERAASLARPPGSGPDQRDDAVIELDPEPLYGDAYLPRKFKIGIAAPGDNCIDVFTQDVGLVPVVDDTGLAGFTVLVGGGMGRSHTNPDTYPRLADPLATIAPEETLAVLTAIVAVQRDHGDRGDREHARFKYLVEEWGVDRVRRAVEERLGRRLRPPRPVVLAECADHLGWHAQGDGRWFLGVKLPSGRVADRDGARVRAALREVVEGFAPGVRLTPREDLLLTDLEDRSRAPVDAILERHGVVPVGRITPVERNAFACPALPTCGLALTESERALPGVLDALEAELGLLGLGGLDVHVRMTGCPNGCARPYSAEIGFVGRGKTSYDVHLGGEPVGTRLNGLFAENVPREELIAVLHPVLVEYRDERRDGEAFGDWCHRVGVDALRRRLGNERWVRASSRSGAGRAAGGGRSVAAAGRRSR